MTTGVHAATQNGKEKVLVIGLGGGGLCSFMHDCLRTVSIDAVEIDDEILNVAKNHFGLKLDSRLNVIIDDGIKFVCETTNNYKAILIDVDSKDPSTAIRCPPAPFLDNEFLKKLKLRLTENGLFILNFVCRDATVGDSTVGQLKEIFKIVQSYKVEEDVNEVIFCTDGDFLTTPEKWSKSVSEMNALIKQNRLSNSNIIDLDDFMKQLKL
jgi:spermidine synthase